MAKQTVNRLNKDLARRLREARRESGMSTRSVSLRMPAKDRVSHATIASYEKGTTIPPIDVLANLAANYNRPLNWFLSCDEQQLTGFTYRNLGHRVPLTDQRSFEAKATKWTEAYRKITEFLRDTSSFIQDKIDLEKIFKNITSPDWPNNVALHIRNQVLDLDENQPVQSVICALEKFPAWAIELKANFQIDNAAARSGDELFVILNPYLANDRIRLNVAHELGHYLVSNKIGQEWIPSNQINDDELFQFAFLLLMPESQLREAFCNRSFIKLIAYKERFGVSLASMIHMAERLKIIPTTHSRQLWRMIVEKEWQDNEPGWVWKDRAITFETILDEAIQSKKITWGQAENITGIQQFELKERLEDAIYMSVQKDRLSIDTVEIFSLAQIKESKQPVEQNHSDQK